MDDKLFNELEANLKEAVARIKVLEDDHEKASGDSDWAVDEIERLTAELQVATGRNKQVAEDYSALAAHNKVLEEQHEYTGSKACLARIKVLESVLKQAEKKLEIYRDHSDGQYHGGIEHTALIRNIRQAIAAAEKGISDE